MHVLIFKPAYNISTKQAFEDFDNFKDLNKFKFKNDFTTLAFSQYKELKTVRDLILDSGASEAELTGSGSALFGIFDDIKTAEKCADSLKHLENMEFCGVYEFV